MDDVSIVVVVNFVVIAAARLLEPVKTRHVSCHCRALHADHLRSTVRVDAEGVAEVWGVFGVSACDGGFVVDGVMIVVVIMAIVIIVIYWVFPRLIRCGAAAEAELDEGL